MRKRIIFVITSAALVAGIAMMLPAQSPNAPVLNQGFAGDRTVSGQAAADSGPFKIYDTSHQTRASVGDTKTSMDNTGSFAVSVKPPLIAGHQIIAVDKHGRSSAPMTVKEPDPATKAPQ